MVTAMVMWALDDIGYGLEAQPSVDPFDGGQVSIFNGLGKVHHFLRPPSLLGIQRKYLR